MAEYYETAEKKFAEHGNQILLRHRIGKDGKWGFIEYIKKIDEKKYYVKMWINGKLVRKYSVIEAECMSDILGKGGDYKYSDEEHPKMPQNQEEYDEYINRRPNIASWKYSNLNIYHEIWDRRLKKQ